MKTMEYSPQEKKQLTEKFLDIFTKAFETITEQLEELTDNEEQVTKLRTFILDGTGLNFFMEYKKNQNPNC